MFQFVCQLLSCLTGAISIACGLAKHGLTKHIGVDMSWEPKCRVMSLLLATCPLSFSCLTSSQRHKRELSICTEFSQSSLSLRGVVRYILCVCIFPFV